MTPFAQARVKLLAWARSDAVAVVSLGLGVLSLTAGWVYADRRSDLGLVFPATCLMLQGALPVAHREADRLLTAQRLLHRRVAPKGARTAAFTAVQIRLLAVWLLAALPPLAAVAPLAWAGDPPALAALWFGPAGVSVVLALGVAIAMRAWGAAAAAGLALVWVLARGLTLLRPIESAAAASCVDATLLLALPLTLLLLSRRLTRLAALPDAFPALDRLLLSPGRGRLQLLVENGATTYRRLDVAIGIVLFGLGCSLLLVGALLAPNWGQQLDLGHALRIAFLEGLASLLIAGRDLSSRLLLAPRGPVRRHLGRRICVGTLTAVGAVALGIAVGWAAMLAAKPPASWLPVLLRGVAFAADLSLASVLAVLVRGLARSHWHALLCGQVVVFAVVGTSADAWQAVIAAGPTWTRGATHIAVTLGLTALAVVASDRAWRNFDLGALWGRRFSGAEDPA